MTTNKTLRHRLGITVEVVRCAPRKHTHTHTPLYTHTHARAHAHTHPVTLAEYGYKTDIRERFFFFIMNESAKG